MICGIAENACISSDADEIKQVGPGAKAKYLLILARDRKPPSRVNVTWQDDSGEQGMFNTTLTI